MEIKNIIFDIGGVLADPKSGHWFITPNFWNIIDEYSINEEELKNSLKKYQYLHTQEPKTEKEEYNMFTDYYYQVLEDINYEGNNKELAKRIADDCVYNDEKFIFYEDVKESLKDLAKKYNLFIISDGWPSSIRVLNNVGINDLFKDILISSLFSTSKAENLFNVFLERNKDIKPEESIYIDDRRHILNKAHEFNFNLLLMDRKNEKPETEYQIINNINDILKYL